MTLIIYEKSLFFFFLRTWRYPPSSPVRSFFVRTSVSATNIFALQRDEKREKTSSVRKKERRGRVNKIPINLHCTMNPMRGRQHNPGFGYLSARRYSRGIVFRVDVYIRFAKDGKIKCRLFCEVRRQHRGDLFRVYARERDDYLPSDRSLFNVAGRYERASNFAKVRTPLK